MPNTFTTNFNLTKPEVGGANDTWGTLVNTNLTDIDSQLFRKADKSDQKGVTHTLTFASGSTFVTTSVARGFASFAVNDKITISHSGNAANKGEFKIEGITNDITLDLETLADAEPTFATETVSSTVSIIAEVDKIIGSLDVSADTLTTSTAQKDAIVDGSTAISRSSGSIQTLSITAAGSSYVGNGALSATGGAGTGFVGTYTISSGAVNAVAITNAGSGYTSAPTIVLTPASGSAGSGATITPTLYTDNDVDFAGDVSVTGNLAVTGDVAVTGATTHTGTLTHSSGSVAEAVTMSGVPRKTLLIQIVPSAGNYQLVSGSSAQKCTHGSVSFSAISGKTYLIELNATVYMWSELDESIGIYCRLYRHTSAKSRGDTSGLGTVLQRKYAQCSVPGADVSLFNLTSAFGGFYMSGVFTASATQTEYVHLVVNNADLDTSSQVNFDDNQVLMKITEFDGDNYTTHTS
jgi:hypothetical protein